MAPHDFFHSNTSLPPNLRPLIILGAARSGTKLLRNLLARSTDCLVIPNSLNELWRTGMPNTASDRRSAADATPHLRAQIQSTLLTFVDQEPETSQLYLVEKTCANTLRVPFVNAILPNAHFIHILRDGRDVAVSAREKWTEGPSLNDLLRKLRTTVRSNPLSLVWHAQNWWTGRDAKLSSWGPRYPGMSDDLQTRTLLEVCARQWRACVTTCLDDLQEISSDRVTTLKYEALVSDRTTLSRLLETLNLTESAPEICEYYDATVHQNSLGRWRRNLTAEERERLDDCLDPFLDRVASVPTISS